jgi:hypothetical protein
MSDKYTTINLNQKEPEFLSFDEDGTLDVDLKSQQDDNDDDDGDEGDTAGSGDENPARVKKSRQQEKRNKRDSRSQRRIRELIEEREQLARELDDIRKQTKDQLSKTKTNARASKEAVKGSLATQVDTIKKQLKRAIEDGDSENVVELQASLHDTQIKLAAVSYELQGEDEEEEVEKNTPQQQQQQRGPSKKALAWVEEHPDFKTDPVFHGAAMMVNNTLIREGYNPDSEDFYEELNERLSSRFPDIFDIEEEDDVEYSGDPSEEEDEEEEDDDEDIRTLNKNKVSLDKNKKSQPPSKKSKSQSKNTKQTTTVSGASRPSSGTKGSAGVSTNRNVVKLSPTDVELAKKWGISLESFARRKKLYESRDKDAGEYVPINIG